MKANWICLDDVAKFMIAALNREDLHFHVKNMLFCRDALAEGRVS